MDVKEFKKWGHEIVEWMGEYLEHVDRYPVKSRVLPGELLDRLPAKAPENKEPFSDMFSDFQNKILPGITHWQSPNFFAYFPANNSMPSILGEMLTSVIGAQCMSWITSPAATELEQRMMEWLIDMIGLPAGFNGVIHDTASVATLCAILSAREKKTDFNINRHGIDKNKYTVYCSLEAHSSIEKAVKIAGLGSANLRKIAVDDEYAMRPKALKDQISRDLKKGLVPLAVIAAVGTTGSTAVDPVDKIAKITSELGLWLHIDAAYAGTAMILPEKRWAIKGIEYADSFVFNPHKWMFTNFDISCYFVRDKETLIRTFEIFPQYLKTSEKTSVNNYRDWGIQLGRRFRALKLWFVIRGFGVRGIREAVAKHMKWAMKLKGLIDSDPDFEIMAPVPFATICLRYKPRGYNENLLLNELNEELLSRVNDSGKLYISHTVLNGSYVLRFVIGQTNVKWENVFAGWQEIKRIASLLKKPNFPEGN